jgi:hypothetical protein
MCEEDPCQIEEVPFLAEEASFLAEEDPFLAEEASCQPEEDPFLTEEASLVQHLPEEAILDPRCEEGACQDQDPYLAEEGPCQAVEAFLVPCLVLEATQKLHLAVEVQCHQAVEAF